MRLIEISVLVILIPLFSVTVFSNLKAIGKTQKKYLAVKKELSADKTIANGFKNLCAKEVAAEKDFENFISECDSLFSLDAIEITAVGIKDKKELLKLTWEKSGRKCEVLAVKEK